MKHNKGLAFDMTPNQPPSGGCVLKQRLVITEADYTVPAAFRRLCVETVVYVVG